MRAVLAAAACAAVFRFWTVNTLVPSPCLLGLFVENPVKYDHRLKNFEV